MIEIRNIEKTKFHKEALLKVIKKFSKSEKDIVLSFDNRVTSLGYYIYNQKKRRHDIKICSKNLHFEDDMANVYELIGTILHELKHLQQQEDLGTPAFGSFKFSCNKRIKDPAASDFYSDREIEARVFEESNLKEAVEYYCKNCEDVLV